jgi:hypothetical protein
MNIMFQSIARAGGIEAPWHPPVQEDVFPMTRVRVEAQPVIRPLVSWFILQTGRRLKGRGERLIAAADRMMRIPASMPH